MNDRRGRSTLLIASYLEPGHVERIRGAVPEMEVLYEPDLLPKPRYPADHTGGPFSRTDAEEARWREFLRRADILFDFDHTNREELPDLAPQVAWIQASSAGIGQFVRQWQYDTRLPHTVFTTARGIHAKPLAEFSLLAMLAHTRNLARMVRDQVSRSWERFAATDLEGRTVTIVGLGMIGEQIARVARSFGMTVLGVKRRVTEAPAATLGLDAVFAPDALHRALPRSEFLVLCAPHTPETEGMIGRSELAALPEGAVLINVGRGALVDESALIDALASGHLAGAALDVFAAEPLPADHPLWRMPNVLISPHSASTSDRENGRLTDLFCDNLQRYVSGQPLRNVLDIHRLY